MNKKKIFIILKAIILILFYCCQIIYTENLTHFKLESTTRFVEIFYGFITGIEINSGDELGVFLKKNNLLIGASIIGDQSLNLDFLNEFWVKTYGDNPNTDNVEGAQSNDKLLFKYWNSKENKEIILVPYDPSTGDNISVFWNGAEWFPTTYNLNLKPISSTNNPNTDNGDTNISSSGGGGSSGAVSNENLKNDYDVYNVSYKLVNNNVIISWNKPGTNKIKYYKIYLKEENEHNYSLIDEINYENDNYTLNNLKFNKKYYIKITTIDENGIESSGKTLSFMLENNNVFIIDNLTTNTVYVQESKKISYKLENGISPYNLEYNKSIIDVLINGDTITINGINSGYSQLLIKDNDNNSIFLKVYVIPSLKKLNVKNITNPFNSDNLIKIQKKDNNLYFEYSIPKYDEPIKLYLGFSYIYNDINLFYTINEQGNFSSNILPYKSNITTEINNNIFLKINSEFIPPGDYTFYYFLQPSGTTFNTKEGYLNYFEFKVDEVPDNITIQKIPKENSLISFIYINQKLIIDINLPYYKNGNVDVYLGFKDNLDNIYVINNNSISILDENNINPYLSNVNNVKNNFIISLYKDFKIKQFYFVLTSHTNPNNYFFGIINND